MVKVNKKKSVNNNNIFKVELEQLRSADKLLNNNLPSCVDVWIEHELWNIVRGSFLSLFQLLKRCSYIYIYIYTIYILKTDNEI